MKTNREELSTFGKFNVLTLTNDKSSAQYLSSDSNYICLLPFELGADSTIKAIYVLEFINKALGKPVHSLVIDEINPDLDKTSYDSVCRSLVEEAGLNIDELQLSENQIFYLGDISTNSPITSTMKCFGIDLTGISAPEFTRALSKDSFTKDESSITRVGFHQVVSGDFTDSTILAGSFLLVSYFN